MLPRLFVQFSNPFEELVSNAVAWFMENAMPFFDAMQDGINSLISGVGVLIESLANFIKWLPAILGMSGQLTSYVPTVFIGIALVNIVIYALKIVLGGDNS